MPQYALLIYSPLEGGPSAEERQAEFPRWYEYTQSLIEAGVYVDGNPLQGLDVATTVRVRDGETQITDGPFAETKELLGGYFVLECPDLDSALGHAARTPHIAYGTVEVRPVMPVPNSPAAEIKAQARV